MVDGRRAALTRPPSAFELEAPCVPGPIDELRRPSSPKAAVGRDASPRSPVPGPVPWRERLEQKITTDLDQRGSAELEVLLLRKGGHVVGPLATAEALWPRRSASQLRSTPPCKNILLGYATPRRDAASGCDIDVDTGSGEPTPST